MRVGGVVSVLLLTAFYVFARLRTRGHTSRLVGRTRRGLAGGRCVGTHCLFLRTCGTFTARSGCTRTIRYNIGTDTLCRQRGCCGRTFRLLHNTRRIITANRRGANGTVPGLHFHVGGRHLRVCVGLGGPTHTGRRLAGLRRATGTSRGSSLDGSLLCARTGCCCAFNVGTRNSTTAGHLVKRCGRRGGCTGMSRYCGALVDVTHGTGGTKLITHACSGCVL